MNAITSTEFKNSFGKYIRLAEKETIEVTKRGLVIFTIVPKRFEMGARLKEYFGILPSNASTEYDLEKTD